MFKVSKPTGHKSQVTHEICSTLCCSLADIFDEKILEDDGDDLMIWS